MNLNFYKYRIAAQLIFWGFYLLIIVLIGLNFTTPKLLWKFAIFNFFIGATAVYTNYIYLLPILMHQKRVWLYLFWGSLLIVVVSLFAYGLQVSLIGNFDRRPNSQALALRIISTICLVGISSAYRFIEEWLQDREGERQRLETELKFLKNQVNPHFLFNSLNNIYSLSYRNDPKTPQMVALLSEIMRYMLYDCSTPRVRLSKEIKLIENFIQVQQIGQTEKLNTDFYYEGIEDNHQIAPMILINFVENAFKHSHIKEDTAAWISMELFVEKGTLHFKIENSQQSLPTPTQSDGGIGQQNALRQLELNYPDHHHIQINDDENVYTIALSIELHHKNTNHDAYKMPYHRR